MADMPSEVGSTELATVLENMNIAGKFSIAVITDRQGLPIASAASPGEDPETQSAVVALIQKTAAHLRTQLGMAQTDEIALYDQSGRRLICRPFTVNNHDMILAVVIPNKKQSYRRLTNQAVTAIRQQWKL